MGRYLLNLKWQSTEVVLLLFLISLLFRTQEKYSNDLRYKARIYILYDVDVMFKVDYPIM